MKFKGPSIAALCLGAIFALMQPALARPAASKPNIVIILADDLGYGDLGCYGATKIKTPNIDRLATDGLRFTQGYAPSSTCTPSRFSLLTGEYAWRRKDRKNSILDGDAPLCIEPGRLTLPALLHQAGYQTGIVGKRHLGLGDGQTPVNFNGEIKPGPLEVGFDYGYIIPANASAEASGLGKGADASAVRFAANHITAPLLFNLATDPGEKTNLFAKYPEKVAEMQKRLAAIKIGKVP